MIRPAIALRFEAEPPGLRGNPGTKLMKSGEGGWTIAYDVETGMVYLRQVMSDGRKRNFAIHSSRLEWVELGPDPEPAAPPRAKAEAAAKP